MKAQVGAFLKGFAQPYVSRMTGKNLYITYYIYLTDHEICLAEFYKLVQRTTIFSLQPQKHHTKLQIQLKIA